MSNVSVHDLIVLVSSVPVLSFLVENIAARIIIDGSADGVIFTLPVELIRRGGGRGE